MTYPGSLCVRMTSGDGVAAIRPECGYVNVGLAALGKVRNDAPCNPSKRQPKMLVGKGMYDPLGLGGVPDHRKGVRHRRPVSQPVAVGNRQWAEHFGRSADKI